MLVCTGTQGGDVSQFVNVLWSYQFKTVWGLVFCYELINSFDNFKHHLLCNSDFVIKLFFPWSFQWCRLREARGHVSPHFYKWLAQETDQTLLTITKALTTKRLIVLLEPISGGTRPRQKNFLALCAGSVPPLFFGPVPPTFKFATGSFFCWHFVVKLAIVKLGSCSRILID